jgi:hypothetical protein
MNKLSHDQVANHFYNLGVQAALGGGMDKTASSAATRALVSRLAPMGSRNIAAGAGHTTLGAGLGAALGAPLGAEAMASLGGLGALGGKVVKDLNTIRLAEQLGALERRQVAKALGDGLGGRVGGAGLSLLTTHPLGGLSEALTNQAVRRRVGL